MRSPFYQRLFWPVSVQVLALAFLLAGLFSIAFAENITSRDVPPIPDSAGPAATAKPSAAPPPGATNTATPQVATPQVAPASDNAIRIGVLLPLSGPQAALGKTLLDAATLALYDMQRNRPLGHPVPLIRLLPRDTQGTPEGAQTAFRDLVKENPTAVLGPLFSAELEAILPLRREANLPLVSFTNNPQLANRGAYQFGYFAGEQAARLADYAARQQVKNIAAVTAADGYGRTVVDLLAKAARAAQIGFAPLILLPPQGQVDEGSLAPLVAALKGSKQRQFLFIAESSPRLEGIVVALIKARALAPNIVIAGSGLWDEPNQLASPALRGAIFASTVKEGFAKFAKNYQTAYGFYPSRIASLSYDATALLVSLIYNGGPQAITDAALQNTDGFTTPANGLLRLRPDGQAERRLAIYMANGKGTARVLEPAPKNFLNGSSAQ